MDLSKYLTVGSMVWPCLLFTFIGGVILRHLYGWFTGKNANAKLTTQIQAADKTIRDKERRILVLEGELGGLRTRLKDTEAKLTAATSVDVDAIWREKVAATEAQYAEQIRNQQATIHIKDTEIENLKRQLVTAPAAVVTPPSAPVPPLNTGGLLGKLKETTGNAVEAVTEKASDVTTGAAGLAVGAVAGAGGLLGTLKEKAENVKEKAESVVDTAKTVVAPPASSAQRDNLEEIVGVGPVLAKLLHDNGVHTFRQIAEWTDADIAQMSVKIEGFKDRIERENWTKQAKELHLKKYGTEL